MGRGRPPGPPRVKASRNAFDRAVWRTSLRIFKDSLQDEHSQQSIANNPNPEMPLTSAVRAVGAIVAPLSALLDRHQGGHPFPSV